jgi:glycosyltransferase involved in cell wall biosynthesis
MFLRKLLSSLFLYKEKLLFLNKTHRLKTGSASVNNSFGVNLVGYLTTESGVGEAARSMVRIIEEAKIPFALNNITPRLLRSQDDTYTNLFRKDNPYCINILHVNADMVPYTANRLGIDWFLNKYNIGYWYWELEEFPKKWKNSLRCFDEIWVASDFCLHAISKISPVPVIKMSPSIEVKMSRSYRRDYFGLRESSFVFLYVFDFLSVIERKNPQAVITAFKKVFGGRTENEVVLVLKLTNPDKNKPAHSEILKGAEGLPLKIIDTYLERDELYGLISVSDCYLSLHRSEGFGLPIAEAMYLGKPAIATAYSGNMEFMNDKNSLLVKYDMQKIEKTAGPYKKGIYWAEPDVNHAGNLMRYVFEDRTKAKQIGATASEYIRKNFSPETLKYRLEHVLNDIFTMHCLRHF